MDHVFKEKKYLAVLQGVTAVAMVAGMLMLSACSSQTPNASVRDEAMPPYADESVETWQETLPPVEFTMTEYEFSYSGELADVLEVVENAQDDSLTFNVKLSKQTETVFVFRLNHAEGVIVEYLTNGKGEKVPVAFEMAEIPSGLSEEDELLFCTAQDAVNEVLASLKLK